MKLETDKIIYAIGGVILGAGLVNILLTLGNKASYYAYAVNPNLATSVPYKPGAKCPPDNLCNGKCINCKPGFSVAGSIDCKCLPVKSFKPTSKPIVNRPSNQTSTGGGGGAVAQGALPYKPKRTLGTFQIDRTKGINGRNYNSGGSSDTTEANVTDIGNAANQMAVVYFNFPANCRGTHGDEADIKLWGPAHHDDNCCWCLVSINGSGDVCTGGEGPHPKTDKCRQKVANVGPIKGKDIGLAHVIQQTSAGAHSEVWVDLGDGFKKKGEFNGPCGKGSSTETSPSANQQPQFRCDCMPNGQYVQIHSAVVYEI